MTQRSHDKINYDFQSKEIFEQIISKIPVHIFWKDRNAVLQGCNYQQAKTLNFRSANEVIGKTNYDMIVSYTDESDRVRQAEEITKVDQKVISEGKSITIEEPLKLPDGSERIYLSNKSPLVSDSGEIIGLLGIAFDITAEKLNTKYKLEKEKAEQEAKLMKFYGTIIDKMPGHVYWKDTNFVYNGCNTNQAINLGLQSPADIKGKTDFDLSPPEIAEKIRKVDQEIIKTKKGSTKEEIVQKPDGKHLVMLSKKSPILDDENNVIGIIGVSFDITAEKEAQKLQLEKAKLEKEKAEEKARLMSFYETIIDLIPGHVYWKNREGIMQGCNLQQAKTLNLTKKDIIGRNPLEMIPDNLPFEVRKQQEKVIRDADQKVFETGQQIQFEEPLIKPDGTVIDFLSTKKPIFDENNNITGLIGVSIDITTEKENQKLQLEKAKLKKEKAEEKARLMGFYETILDLFPGHVYWQDLDGIILGTNKQQALTAGFENKQDIIGKTNADLPWADQADYLKQNNDAVIASGKLQTLEEVYEVPGEPRRYFLSKKQPLRNERNEIIGLLGVSFDITAEKEMQRLQLEKLQQEKEEAEHKAELMKVLAGSIAHELRTPLGALSSYAQGISMHLPKLLEIVQIAQEANLELPYINKQQLKTMHQLAQSIKTEVQAGFHFIDMLLKNIQQDLRGYAMQKISLKECICSALERYPFQSYQKHIVHVDLQKDIIFEGNADLMVHVLFNLLKNSLFHVGSDKNARIDIIVPENEANVLFFRDNGVGISPEVLPYIFEKFYSKSRHGTGVGLAFCKMAIESFSATISCKSELGCYTEFIITFPKSLGENYG